MKIWKIKNMQNFRKSAAATMACFERRWRPRKFSAKLALLSFVAMLLLFTNPLHADEGSAENISILMSSNIAHSPVGATNAPNIINGAVVDYSIAVTGPSIGGSPATSLKIGNPIPAEMSLFVGDIANVGSGPVAFVEIDSGLSYRFDSLASSNDALEFSNNGGQSFDYVPSRDADGYDKSVTHVRITPRGTLMPANGRHTRFSVRYRMKVK